MRIVVLICHYLLHLLVVLLSLALLIPYLFGRRLERGNQVDFPLASHSSYNSLQGRTCLSSRLLGYDWLKDALLKGIKVG